MMMTALLHACFTEKYYSFFCEQDIETFAVRYFFSSLELKTKLLACDGKDWFNLGEGGVLGPIGSS